MQLSSLALAAVLAFAGSPIAASQPSATVIPDCRVTLIDDIQIPADLPANEAGLLMSLDLQRPLRNPDGTPRLDQNGRPLYENLPRLKVREGMSVRAGDVLGRVDTRMAEKQRDVAEAQLRVAELEAANDVSTRYAEKAALVAKYEHEKNVETNESAPGAIAAIEIFRLLLSYEQAVLQIEQAKHELAIAKISVAVRETQFALANREVERRTIKAPIDGVIQEIRPQVGEWLRPGDPVMRIVGMERLRVKGQADAKSSQSARIQEGKTVQIQVQTADGRVLTVNGTLVFVSRIIDTGSRFDVWADVINEQARDGSWPIQPGMNATMTILP